MCFISSLFDLTSYKLPTLPSALAIPLEGLGKSPYLVLAVGVSAYAIPRLFTWFIPLHHQDMPLQTPWLLTTQRYIRNWTHLVSVRYPNAWYFFSVMLRDNLAIPAALATACLNSSLAPAALATRVDLAFRLVFIGSMLLYSARMGACYTLPWNIARYIAPSAFYTR